MVIRFRFRWLMKTWKTYDEDADVKDWDIKQLHGTTCIQVGGKTQNEIHTKVSMALMMILRKS